MRVLVAISMVVLCACGGMRKTDQGPNGLMPPPPNLDPVGAATPPAPEPEPAPESDPDATIVGARPEPSVSTTIKPKPAPTSVPAPSEPEEEEEDVSAVASEVRSSVRPEPPPSGLTAVATRLSSIPPQFRTGTISVWLFWVIALAVAIAALAYSVRQP